MFERVLIVGTGLIGTSIGLALREAGFEGYITGIDSNFEERSTALRMRAMNEIKINKLGERLAVQEADLIILAVPVLAILDWMQQVSAILKPHQLVTDVGSTKERIAEMASRLFNGPGQGRFLPGHPMAGKESGGAALGEASLFDGATWLFTPVAEETELEREWRGWVGRFGCWVVEMEAGRHDVVCAWVSHMPQMVATAMAALLEDEFRDSPEAAAEFMAIGGRALREMTRLGASPYSMWRDVALTNTDAVSGVLFALEQRLAHVRENLKTPELRDEFRLANAFRRRG